MIKVARLQTGQFVLIHDATGTVIVAEELQTAYGQMSKELGDKGISELAELPAAPPALGGESVSSGARFIMMLGFVVLPFIWIAAMYYSLGAILDHGIQSARDVFESREVKDQLGKDLQKVRDEQVSLAQSFEDLKLKTAPAPEDLKQLRNELDVLKQQHQAVDARSASLAAQSSATMQEVAALEQQDAALKTRLEKLEAAAAAVPPAAPAPVVESPGN